MAMFHSSAEIMQDCVSAKRARIFSKLRHSSSLACVCSFAEGRGEECVRLIRLLIFQLLGFCISLVSEQIETYMLGSVLGVSFVCFRPHLGGVLAA